MKKITFLLFAAGSLIFSSCVKKTIPAKMTLDYEKDRTSYQDFSISPLDDSVLLSKEEITIAPESEGAVYTLSGYFSGQITVKTKNTTLILSNAFLENKRGKAAIKSVSNLTLSVSEGSTNYIISGGRNYSKSAALQAKKTLTLDADGTLFIIGNTFHGAEADTIKIKGGENGKIYAQGTWKGSALSCEDFISEDGVDGVVDGGDRSVGADNVLGVDGASCSLWCINSKNGIKADDSITIRSGTFYFYSNETALKTETGKKSNGTVRSIQLAGGTIYCSKNDRLFYTNMDESNLTGALVIEEDAS